MFWYESVHPYRKKHLKNRLRGSKLDPLILKSHLLLMFLPHNDYKPMETHAKQELPTQNHFSSPHTSISLLHTKKKLLPPLQSNSIESPVNSLSSFQLLHILMVLIHYAPKTISMHFPSFVLKMISSMFPDRTSCCILFCISPPGIPANGLVFLFLTLSLPERAGRKKAVFPRFIS